MKKSVLINLLSVMVFCLIPFSAGFAQTVDDLVLMTEQYPPFNFEEDGKLQGISVDLLDQMLKKVGSKLTRDDIQLLPWAKGYKAGLTKKNNVIFSTTRTAERETLFKWVGPFAPTRISLTARKDKNIKINTINDVKRYRIGVIRDDVGEQLLVAAGIPKKNLDRTAKAISNIKKLSAGKIDMWSYEETVAKWFIKKNSFNPADYEVVHVLKEGVLSYAFNKDTPDSIIQKLQNALDGIKKSGEYEKILDKYLK